MKQNSFLISCVLLVFTTSIISCSKEGPAGPAGATGAVGPAGPTGPTGIVNVIYSGWLDVTYLINADSSWYVTSIAAPKLDANMLSKGEIKVYMNWGTTAAPDVTPLPFFDGSILINVDFSVTKIDLSSNYNLSTNATKQGQVRYILIPGGTTASLKGIDWKNYKQVQTALGIQN